MPIYAYRCDECGFAKDVLQKISDEPLSVCPSCGKSSFKKQITAAGFQLKGSGWYVTDFRGGSGSGAASGIASAPTESGGEASAGSAAGASAATSATSDAAPAKASSPASSATTSSAPASSSSDSKST